MCRPPDSTMTEGTEIEPGTVATYYDGPELIFLMKLEKSKGDHTTFSDLGTSFLLSPPPPPPTP